MKVNTTNRLYTEGINVHVRYTTGITFRSLQNMCWYIYVLIESLDCRCLLLTKPLALKLSFTGGNPKYSINKQRKMSDRITGILVKKSQGSHRSYCINLELESDFVSRVNLVQVHYLILCILCGTVSLNGFNLCIYITYKYNLLINQNLMALSAFANFQQHSVAATLMGNWRLVTVNPHRNQNHKQLVRSLIWRVMMCN